MKIVDIFKKIEKEEGHIFIPNQLYKQNTLISIKDENGNMVKVNSMILKIDESLKITFNDNTFIGIAKKHLIKILDGLIFADELKVNDIVYNINGNKIIKKIDDIGVQNIYDLAIDTENHLYQDHLGFIHHNTYTVVKEIEKMLGPQGDKWVLIKGKSSPLGLYSSLFVNRDKLIVFDDIDSIFGNKDTINMLKASVDSYDTRVISWISPITVDVSKLDAEQKQELYDQIETKLSTDPENAKIKYPNSFGFTGRVIFISNISEDKMDSAIKSRSFVIDITLKAKDVFNRMASILKNILPDVDLNTKETVLDFLREKHEQNDITVDIRTLINGVKCKLSGSDRWQHLAEFYA